MSTVSIEIRPARAEDASEIAGVHDAAWRLAYQGLIPGRELERMIQRRGPAWWAAAIRRGSRLHILTVAGEVAAYASHGRNRAHALGVAGEIYELYVRPEYQGMGLGRRLFTAARRELDTRNLKGLAVWALAENDGACGFYRRLGGIAAARGHERFGVRSVEKLAFVWRG